MNVKLHLSGEDQDQGVESLKEWLEDSSINGLETIRQEATPPKEGELGWELLPDLLLILSSDVTATILGSSVLSSIIEKVFDWISANPFVVEVEMVIEDNELKSKTIKMSGGNSKKVMDEVKKIESSLSKKKKTKKNKSKKKDSK